MSRPIPGIKGIPFRKIVKREYPPLWQNRVVEVLSCGHRNMVRIEQSQGATKRRCYHLDCKIKPVTTAET